MASILKTFSNRRMLVLLLLGLSSGLPLALITGTLQAWMTDEGISIQALGAFSLVTLPYALKFMWAPILDRFLPPFFSAHGRRLGWIILSQLLLMILISGLGLVHPGTQLHELFLLSLLTAFTSATQDIVVDAYRADLLSRDELGPGASVAILGYRIGMLTSGAIALSLAEILPWRVVYLTMAIVQAIGVIAAMNAPKPVADDVRPRSLNDAVVLPLVEYFKRRGAYELLIFIVLYKLSDVMATMFTTRFMLETGFSKAEIAAVVKGLGLAATMIGSLAGGGWMVRLGMQRGLLVFGAAQGITNLAYAVLALAGKNYWAMVAAIGIENLGAGLGTAAFTAFLTGLCHHRFTATQYALLTGLAALSRSFMGPPCGFLASHMSWFHYFVVAAAASIPSLLMVQFRYNQWSVQGGERADI